MKKIEVYCIDNNNNNVVGSNLIFQFKKYIF